MFKVTLVERLTKQGGVGGGEGGRFTGKESAAGFHCFSSDYLALSMGKSVSNLLLHENLHTHRHGWTNQGLWLLSHTDTAGHTKAFDYSVTQTRLDIPRPLITQSHRHGWTYQGLWLPSHTHTAGHTKAFDYTANQPRHQWSFWYVISQITKSNTQSYPWLIVSES